MPHGRRITTRRKGTTTTISRASSSTFLPSIEPADIVERIASATGTHDILRVKGFADVRGKPMRLLIQGVGSRLQHQFDRAWRPGEARRGRIVVIGQKGLDREAIARSIAGGVGSFPMHLLATETATLDEIETAVDLGQTPADVVVLSFSDSDLSALAAAWRADRDALPSLRLASLKRLRHPMSVDLYVDSVIAKSRFVIVRSLGGLDYWRYGFERVAAACGRDVGLVALPGDDRADARLGRSVDRAAAVTLRYSTATFAQAAPAISPTRCGSPATLLGRKSETPADAARAARPVVGMTRRRVRRLDIADLPPPAIVPWRWSSSIAPACWRPTPRRSRALHAEHWRRRARAFALAITSLKDPRRGGSDQRAHCAHYALPSSSTPQRSRRAAMTTRPCSMLPIARCCRSRWPAAARTPGPHRRADCRPATWP